ncbi:transglycosylase domain-containing protein [Altererythrobacter sp. GH1-8]|uniref:transglycosylase domain-containing protein n=1 Tax=Altererythrobacter sp. GH1-8 TaxID=3349333 RepID=UPI00374CCF2C
MFAWLRKSRSNRAPFGGRKDRVAPGFYATQDPWGSQLDQFDRDFDLDFDDDAEGGFDAPPAKPHRKGRKRRWFVRIVAAILLLFIIAVGWLALTAPLSKSLEPIAPPQITLLASDGTPIARSGANVEAPVDVEKLPEHVVGAFLAIEDRRFYSHWGVDPRGIARAAWTGVGGGSTITQQLAKFTFLTPERSLSRKGQEMLIAFWLEAWLTKDEILERYLSNAYFGDNQYGLRAASLHYFYRQPENLRPEQAAMLAGLLQAPSRLDPTDNYKGAEARMRLVLNAMAEEGYLTPERAAALPSPRLDVRTRNTLPTGTYFADWVLPLVRQDAERSYAKQSLTTTLDARLQRVASEVVGRARLGKAQVALVAMRPTGEVVAMIGGKDYAKSPFNRATQAKRQPGSTFKLFTYLAAIEAGMDPGDRVPNTPIENGSYRPRNAGDRYTETISLEDAFAQSSNVATVRLFNELGSAAVIKTARNLGVTAELPVGDPSLALGTSSMTLLELTAAYAGVAANRFPVKPVAFVPEERGWSDWFFSDEDSLSSREHAAIERLLRSAVNKGTGRAAALTMPNYGKTGTTQNYRDALFVGYAGGLVVGVWVGNDDNTPLDRVTGGGLPARIWRDFMVRALSAEAAPVQDVPDPMGPIQPLDVPDNFTIPVDGRDLEVNLRDGSVIISGEADGIPLELIIGEDGISLDQEKLQEALQNRAAEAERPDP